MSWRSGLPQDSSAAMALEIAEIFIKLRRSIKEPKLPATLIR
jgi:hypothetical protein